MTSYQIALAPPQYYWPKSQLLSFYAAIADSAADIVYLGETVCSRRHEMRPADWLGLAQDLRTAGKTVVLASQTLIESEGEALQMRRLCAQDEFMVEAGDMGALRRLQGKAFVAGPHLNLYHGDSLRWVRSLGATRFVAPFELDRAGLAALLAELPDGLAGEVMVWGRLPLAFSARCFTARHYRLRKDDCGFRCIEHPDGLTLRTRDGQDFLAINGIQTQSAACLDLIDEAGSLVALGASVLRINPQSVGTLEAIARLAAQRQGGALHPIPLPPGMQRCNGYWHGHAGIGWRA